MGNDDRVRVPARIGNWLLDQNLGSGYSGSIWRATNPFTGQVAAIKVQDVDHECPTNRYERGFYPSLQGGVGMPTLWAAGIQGDYDYLVIDLLGPSLDNMYRKNNKRMDLRSTICIAMQVISRLEFMHSRGILHRDIQLGNCVVGLEKNEGVIYMIDFGFSKRYIDPHTHKHIPDSKAKRDFIGNYWFSSVNVHCRGKVPSRRDDMEALALMLIHLVTENGLPWTRNGVPKTDKLHDIIIRKKLNARPDVLCRGLPPVFEEFLRYCRRLRFLDQPNYRFWRKEFAALAREKGYVEPDGSVSDALVWPPRLEEVPRPRPLSHRAPIPAGQRSMTDVDIEKVLGEIANLNLDSAIVPGAERPAVAPVPTNQDSSGAGAGAAAPNIADLQNSGQLDTAPEKAKQQADFIVISSDGSSDPSSRQLDRYAKQAAIRLLTRQARKAIDNAELGKLLRQFVDMLQANRSKVVTKEAFDFLAALSKQLEDPSVFVVPDSRATSGNSDANSAVTNGSQTRLRQRPPPAPKVETVKTIRQRLQTAPLGMGNTQLALMLTEFSAAVRATSGKTLTRDGMAFLEGVESRLKD
ncbi:CK1/CK1 protein kinase [Phellopilus nigrolimitatus]|nr:CK1/CK1 protein kinase [Phellopilus nigrolimitatus]